MPAVLQNSQAELKAVYSRSIKSVNGLLEAVPKDQKVDGYSEDTDKGLDDLLARSDIQIVIVALTINGQPEAIKKAFKAGKHVLSEKPLTKDVESSKDLLSFYNSLSNKPLWACAENFRYMVSFTRAQEVAATLGDVTTFHLQMFAKVVEGNKWFETPWRKVPDYQGGFILDGGVHFVAGLRKALGPRKIVKVAAFSKLNQSYLPPVDTVNGVILLDDGTSGTITISFGTTKGGLDIVVQHQLGWFEVNPGKLVVKHAGEENSSKDLDVSYEGNEGQPAVAREVDAFISGVLANKLDPEQAPEEAFLDLAIIEALLTSGDKGGVLVPVATI